MAEKEDRIDFLLKSLMKTGELAVEDKIIEHLMDLSPDEELPRVVKEKTIKKLEKRQRELVEIKKRLEHPQKLHSFGEYLSLFRKKENADLLDLARGAGIESAKLTLLEEDRISPLDFGLDKMAQLVQSVRLSGKTAITLLRKSYQLFKLQPDLTKASARYDHRTEAVGSKTDAMNRALKELMLKSAKRKGLTISDPKLEEYLNELEKRLV